MAVWTIVILTFYTPTHKYNTLHLQIFPASMMYCDAYFDHHPDTPWKRDPQLKNYLKHIGLWGGIFLLIGVGGLSTLWLGSSLEGGRECTKGSLEVSL